MTNYIKDELLAIDSAIATAKKHNVQKIKNLLIDIKKVFEEDQNKKEINALYDNMPLVYISLSDQINQVKRCH